MPTTHERELRDYLMVLRRRKFVILLTTVIVVAAAVVSSYLQTPVYSSSTKILFQQRDPGSILDPGTEIRQDSDRLLQNEVEFLKSEIVADGVAEELSGRPTVTATGATGTDVIRIRATSTDPERAAEIANVYAATYLEIRREAGLDEYARNAEVAQKKIDEIGVQIADVEASKNELLVIGGPEANTTSLDTELTSLESQQSVWAERLQRIQAEADLVQGTAPTIIDFAQPASEPFSPNTLRNVAIALLVGLGLGIGVAFLVDYLDDSIKSKDDLQRAAGDLPVLAYVPRVATPRGTKEPRTITLDDPASPAAEAYRSLRTSIQFKGIEEPIRTLLVTSPRAADGKTTTAANLGVAFARANYKVALVSCDLRRPKLHEYFDKSNEVGLTSVLVGDVELLDAIQAVKGSNGALGLLASGPVPPNPSELLSTNRTKELVGMFGEAADLVIIDAPPVLPVTDALILSELVDAAILVASTGSTSRREMHRAYELLHQVGAPLIGTVLNNVPDGPGYGYGYGYGSSYYAEERSGKRRARFSRGSDSSSNGSEEVVPEPSGADKRA